MENKKRVLIISDPLQYGGSDLVAVRLQQNLDDEKFDCTYSLRYEHKGPMEDDVAKTGVRIIHQPDNQLSYVKSYKYYINLFKKEKFDVVHCHLPFYSGLVMLAAYKCKIKKRVAHSHFSQPLVLSKSKLKNALSYVYRAFMRLLIDIYATDIIGCSQEAGEYLAGKRGFKKKGKVLDNGIVADDYLLDEDKRKQKRSELGIEDKIVLGHIGQMYYVKNHKFLIDVFYDFQKKHKDSVLLLVSDGPDRADLEKKVKDLGIEEKVKFLGFRTDIPELMMAMDCFVFPSIHEGFPLTLIEAQAARLPCVVSDTVTDRVKLNDNVEFASIKLNPAEWVCAIEQKLAQNRWDINNKKVIDNFDIKSVSKKLEVIYLS